MCSIGATLLILMTLVSFEQYEKRKKMGQESKVIGLTVEGVLENIDDYKRVFNEADVHLSTFFVEYDYDRNVTEPEFRGSCACLYRSDAPFVENQRRESHKEADAIKPA